MYITWRDEADKTQGYFLMEEDGTEIHQAHAKDEQWARARRRKVSVDAIILEDAAKALGRDKIPANERHREVKIIRVEPGEHFHDDRYLLGMPEHEHDQYKHGHEHGHGEIDELTRDLKAHDAANLEAFRLTDRAILDHKHPEKASIVHPHDDLNVAIAGVVQRLGAVEEHSHTDVPWHDHREVDAQLQALRSDVIDLNQRLAYNASELRKYIDEQVEAIKAMLRDAAGRVHEHDVYAKAADLVEHIESVGKRSELRVLSNEEVAGKRRWIVEEVK